MSKFDWISEKGVRFIVHPKRGMCTDINPTIAQTITAKGQMNWTGTFISPTIKTLIKSSEIGSKQPVKIIHWDGTECMFDGENFIE